MDLSPEMDTTHILMKDTYCFQSAPAMSIPLAPDMTVMSRELENLKEEAQRLEQWQCEQMEIERNRNALNKVNQSMDEMNEIKSHSQFDNNHNAQRDDNRYDEMIQMKVQLDRVKMENRALREQTERARKQRDEWYVASMHWKVKCKTLESELEMIRNCPHDQDAYNISAVSRESDVPEHVPEHHRMDQLEGEIQMLQYEIDSFKSARRDNRAQDHSEIIEQRIEREQYKLQQNECEKIEFVSETMDRCKQVPSSKTYKQAKLAYVVNQPLQKGFSGECTLPSHSGHKPRTLHSLEASVRKRLTQMRHDLKPKQEQQHKSCLTPKNIKTVHSESLESDRAKEKQRTLKLKMKDLNGRLGNVLQSLQSENHESHDEMQVELHKLNAERKQIEVQLNKLRAVEKGRSIHVEYHSPSGMLKNQ